MWSLGPEVRLSILGHCMDCPGVIHITYGRFDGLEKPTNEEAIGYNTCGGLKDCIADQFGATVCNEEDQQTLYSYPLQDKFLCRRESATQFPTKFCLHSASVQ